MYQLTFGTAIKEALLQSHLKSVPNFCLMGIPATGKQLKIYGMVLSRFEEGKIIEEWEILDMLSMFQQLGVVSLPA